MTIEIRDLSFRYHENAITDTLSDISLQVKPGELHFLIGPNGSGKSTLIKCIAGLLTPSGGEITIAGDDIHRMSSRNRASLIGYVPQSEVPAFSYSVRDIVVMGRAAYHHLFGIPSAKDYREAERAMKRVDISHLADRICTDISGGEWQLTLIARALTQHPSLLLMDEPTSHLDLSNQMRILETIRDLIQLQYTVIFVSHNPDQTFLMPSLVSVMKEGRIIKTGNAEEVITPEIMEDTYGIPVLIVSRGGSLIRSICVPVLSDHREVS